MLSEWDTPSEPLLYSDGPREAYIVSMNLWSLIFFPVVAKSLSLEPQIELSVLGLSQIPSSFPSLEGQVAPGSGASRNETNTIFLFVGQWSGMASGCWIWVPCPV